MMTKFDMMQNAKNNSKIDASKLGSALILNKKETGLLNLSKLGTVKSMGTGTLVSAMSSDLNSPTP